MTKHRPSAPALPLPAVALALVAALLLAATALAHQDPPETPGPPGEAAAGLACSGGHAGIYPCHDVDLLAFVPRDELGLGATDTLNDIWGWTDPQTGTPYALVGTSIGTAFVSLEDPTKPRFLGILPTRTLAAPWRDVKVYQGHAIVVADVAGHGLQVFDLTRLRGVGSPRTWQPDVEYAGPGFGALGGFALGNAHNVAVDEATGFAYAVGSNTCNGGLHMVDVRQPKRPRFAGCFGGTGYIHDTQCVVYHGPDAAFAGRELCFNSNVGSLSIVDVTDKKAPRLIADTPYAGVEYAHQGWLTDDQRYFLLGDELDELRDHHNAETYVFDVSSLSAPRLVGTYDTRPAGDRPQPLRPRPLRLRGQLPGRPAHPRDGGAGRRQAARGGLLRHRAGPPGTGLSDRCVERLSVLRRRPGGGVVDRRGVVRAAPPSRRPRRRPGAAGQRRPHPGRTPPAPRPPRSRHPPLALSLSKGGVRPRENARPGARRSEAEGEGGGGAGAHQVAGGGRRRRHEEPADLDVHRLQADLPVAREGAAAAGHRVHPGCRSRCARRRRCSRWSRRG